MTMPIKQDFTLLPTSFAEAEKYATMIAKSSFCPAGFKGNAGDVLIAVQMGKELGLQPIQALQNIAVINGKPSIYGDAMLALVKNHPEYEYMREEQTDDYATCIIKRRNEPEIVSTFTRKDAELAGLWGKQGPWKSYPKRMMQMRARGFACRDGFPDALKGLISAEEAQDYPVEAKRKEKFMGTIKKEEPIPVNSELVKEEILNNILLAENIDELRKVYELFYKSPLNDNGGLLKEITEAKDNRKIELEKPTIVSDDEWTKEYDEAKDVLPTENK